jgi:hypothetical protein
VFIPNTTKGPAPDLATVHIARLGMWSPWNEGSRTAIALESILDGLRSRRAVVPEDLSELFHAKFVNPFLGIAAAHALLLDPKPPLKLLKTVIGNLEELTPQNPDVIALTHRAREAGAEVKARDGAAWPPLLYAGYRALLRADATRPGAIADDSEAERAAARLRVSGLWTTWSARSTTARRASARSRGSQARTSRKAEPELDPATARVRAYVEAAARVRKREPAELLDMKSVRQIAMATGLPSNAAFKSMNQLRADLE